MSEQKQFCARTPRLCHFHSGGSSDVRRHRVLFFGLFAATLLLILGCFESPNDTALRPPPSVRNLSPNNGVTITNTRPVITLTVDEYIDPESVTTGSLRLRAGSTTAFGRTRLDPLDQTLLLTLTSALTPGLTYEVELAPNVTGFGTDAVQLQDWSFTVASAAQEVEATADTRPTWEADIQPLLHEACGCHEEDSSPPPRLTRGLLELDDAVARSRRYVAPGDPSRSYLLHKVLPDYPDRFGTVMPPPWSDQPALTAQQVRLISDWISAGTP
ncbi:MAG: hypothetical protein ACJA1R_000563 [Flavobacteriales bacterium]|jgi:hypothetical protein